MTAALLTTATLTGGVLCSTQPLPTDGLPEWWKCPTQESRLRPDDSCDECRPDGPFPVTVGVVDPNGLDRHDETGTWVGTADAVTTLVEVTGPSHRARDFHEAYGPCHETFIGPGLPKGWHTPVRVVERLDTPIPVDVPTVCPATSRYPYPDGRPAVWWVPA